MFAAIKSSELSMQSRATVKTNVKRVFAGFKMKNF